MSKTYYNFSAHSAVSFAVVHGGRRFFVNFSPLISGVSRYLTTDKKLADKIVAHRWFRQGLITLNVEVENDEKPVSKVELINEAVHTKAASSGFTLSSLKAQAANPVVTTASSTVEQPIIADTETEAHTPVEVEEKTNFSIDEVSTFVEARQYMIDVIGITTPIKSKEDLLALCTEHNIEFPNYPL